MQPCRTVKVIFYHCWVKQESINSLFFQRSSCVCLFVCFLQRYLKTGFDGYQSIYSLSSTWSASRRNRLYSALYWSLGLSLWESIFHMVLKVDRLSEHTYLLLKYLKQLTSILQMFVRSGCQVRQLTPGQGLWHVWFIKSEHGNVSRVSGAMRRIMVLMNVAV